MKYFLTITLLILLFASHVSAQSDPMEDPQSPVIDSGEGYGEAPGGNKQTSDEIFQDFLNIFFGSRPIPTSAPQNGNNTTQPTINPSISPNDEPSGASLSPSTIAPTLGGSNNSILGNTNLPYPESLLNSVQTCLQNSSIYQEAQARTGIPWQVLAGIHFTEGNCRSNVSLVSGRPIGGPEPDVSVCSSQDTGLGKPHPIGFDAQKNRPICAFNNLLDTAIYAGDHLKGKGVKFNNPNNIPQNHEQLVWMVSKYNGGGNANCLGGTPYQYCPPLFDQEDDTYVFNKNPDGRHEVMWIRYCVDGKTCAEIGRPNPVHQVYGVLTVAGALSTL